MTFFESDNSSLKQEEKYVLWIITTLMNLRYKLTHKKMRKKCIKLGKNVTYVQVCIKTLLLKVLILKN